jgi:hypothetical protein
MVELGARMTRNRAERIKKPLRITNKSIAFACLFDRAVAVATAFATECGVEHVPQRGSLMRFDAMLHHLTARHIAKRMGTHRCVSARPSAKSAAASSRA